MTSAKSFPSQLIIIIKSHIHFQFLISVAVPFWYLFRAFHVEEQMMANSLKSHPKLFAVTVTIRVGFQSLAVSSIKHSKQSFVQYFLSFFFGFGFVFVQVENQVASSKIEMLSVQVLISSIMLTF